MRLLLVVALTFVLTGCGEQSFYTKKGVSEEKMAADIFDCLLKIGNVSNPKMRLDVMEQLCMKSKGYQVHHGEPPKDAEDIMKK